MGTTTLSAPRVDATQDIWSEFSHRLRGFIVRRVESEADAEDILQEVFVRIHQHAATVERSERLASWLFQITRNAIVDYYRAPRRRRELPGGVSDDLEQDWAYAMGASDDDGVGLMAVRSELANCLRPMVAQLPPRYREAVTLVDLDGLPQKEAAARLGLSLSGLKSRVQRGRRALGQVMQDCCRLDFDAGGRIVDYQLRGAECGHCGSSCGSG